MTRKNTMMISILRVEIVRIRGILDPAMNTFYAFLRVLRVKRITYSIAITFHLFLVSRVSYFCPTDHQEEDQEEVD